MSAPDDILTRLNQPGNSSPGSYQSDELELTWSKESIHLRKGAEGHEVQVDELLAIQVSRARDEGPRPWWRRLLGLRPITRDVLNVALRTRGGEDLRLNAVANEGALQGLPWMQQSRGVPVPVKVLLDVVSTVRNAGVSVASWSPEAVHRQPATPPETLELSRPFPKSVLVLLGLWFAIPGFLLLVSDWLRPSAWIIAFAMLVVVALLYGAFRPRLLRIVRLGSERTLEKGSLLLPARWVPLEGLDRLLLRSHALSGRWELIADGTKRRPFLLAAGNRNEVRQNDDAGESRSSAMASTPAELAASVSGILGLELDTEEGPPRTPQPIGIYLLISLLITVFAGWVAERIPGNHEVTRLGGWFTGSSNLLAAVTGSLTMDYSLIGSPDAVELTALSPDGRWAVTGDRDALLVWDAQTGEVVEELEAPQVGIGNWIGFSLDGEKLYAVLNENAKPRLKRWSAGDWDEDLLSGPTLAKGSIYHSEESEVFCARSASDFRLVRIANGAVEIISTEGSIYHRRIARVTMPFHLRSPDTMVFSPDCETTWLMDFSQHEACWIDTGERNKPETDGPRVECIELPEVDDEYRETVIAGDNDGRRLAYFVNGSLAVIERDHPTDPVQVISGDWDGNPWLYRPRLGFSPNGRLVVSVNHSAGFNAAPARVYVYGEDYALERVMEGHFDGITAPLRFNGDGSLLLTGSRDQTARIWEMP